MIGDSNTQTYSIVKRIGTYRGFRDLLWVLQGQCFVFGALYPSKSNISSGLIHKHIDGRIVVSLLLTLIVLCYRYKHIVKHIGFVLSVSSVPVEVIGDQRALSGNTGTGTCSESLDARVAKLLDTPENH